MSKSLGNVILAKDAIEQYSANVIRLLLLNTHYRNIINFTDEVVNDTKSIINKIGNCYKQLNLKIQLNNGVLQGFSSKTTTFLEYFADDFNIPNCVTYTLDLVKEANLVLRNKNSTLEEVEDLYYALTTIIYILGLDFSLKVLTEDDIKVYQEYNEAKQNKNFELSDKLRNILIERKIF